MHKRCGRGHGDRLWIATVTNESMVYNGHECRVIAMSTKSRSGQELRFEALMLTGFPIETDTTKLGECNEIIRDLPKMRLRPVALVSRDKPKKGRRKFLVAHPERAARALN